MGLGSKLMKGLLVFGAVATPLALISSSVEKHEHNTALKLEKIKADKELKAAELHLKATAYENYTSKRNLDTASAYTQNNRAEYEFDILCAKAAVCSYIIWADGSISVEELEEIEEFTKSASRIGYSSQKINVLNQIFHKKCSSFLVVENYLRKLNIEDLSMLKIIAEEVAQLDGTVSISEQKAINNVFQYVDSKTNSASNSYYNNTKDTKTKVTSQKPIKLKCQYCKKHFVAPEPDVFSLCPICKRRKYEVSIPKGTRTKNKTLKIPSVPPDPFNSKSHNNSTFIDADQYFHDIDNFKKEYLDYLENIHIK